VTHPRSELVVGEIRILIVPRSHVTWAGTQAQLAEEGLVPEGFEWPRGIAAKRWRDTEFEYKVVRVSDKTIIAPDDELIWGVQRHRLSEDIGRRHQRVEAYEKQRSAELAALYATPEWAQRLDWHAWHNFDADWQRFFRGLQGLPYPAQPKA